MVFRAMTVLLVASTVWAESPGRMVAEEIDRYLSARAGDTHALVAEPKLSAVAAALAKPPGDGDEWRRRGDGRYERVDKSTRRKSTARPETGREAPPWTIDVVMYLWIPASVDGDSTVAGTSVPLDLDLEDVLDLFEFGVSARVEAWKGVWGIFLDAMYVDLELEVTTPMAGINVDIQQWNVDLGVAYRVLDRMASKRPWAVDLMVGAGFVDLRQKVSLTPGPNLGGSEDYLELMIGFRLIVALTQDRKWVAVLRADARGFGFGSGSDLTWSAIAGVGRRIGDNKQIRFGYRVYDTEYLKNSTFGFDATLHGPYLAFRIQF